MTANPADICRSFFRYECSGTPLYVRPEVPDWFVPSRRTDRVLQLLCANASAVDAAREDSRTHAISTAESLLQIEKLLLRLERSRRGPHPGRGAILELKQLKECWFHLTSKCNMSCSHCLFGSSPSITGEMLFHDVLSRIEEARKLGCRVFCFTGGEPLVFERFTDVCHSVLRHPECHLVILTNGQALGDYRGWLSRADLSRVHFQISVDGREVNHDRLRGPGAYRQLMGDLDLLNSLHCNCTLAMCVTQDNLQDMSGIVDLAAEHGIKNVHYMWLFHKGHGKGMACVDPGAILEGLLAAKRSADAAGVLIDNIEILKSQLFCLPGTRFDLSNAAWQSLAVGPDGTIYPSPAMIGEPEMAAGHIGDGLENVWKNSKVLQYVRNASLIDTESYRNHPMRFLIGGGDIDHSFHSRGLLTGHDPYVEVYTGAALRILADEAARYTPSEGLTLVLRMGERLYECNEDMGACAFTHSNCVLSLPSGDGHTLVTSFYSAAAGAPNREIANPVTFNEDLIEHIPAESRLRSYGCGSPVLDSDLQAGQTVIDLGCGTGLECFIAAGKVGPSGKVIGIDMAEAMLDVARKSRARVCASLSYDNIEFRQAFLEHLPLASQCADVVISNCVINLSPDKRRTFAEIVRILKPGGRMVISDIVSIDEIPLAIKYNEKLRGECLGGAFQEHELFALLDDLGFAAPIMIKRFPYRRIQGHAFFSLTYSAVKPRGSSPENLLYRGPFAAVITGDGTVLRSGHIARAKLPEGFPAGDSVFTLDDSGNVTGGQQDSSCTCCPAPEPQPACAAAGAPAAGNAKSGAADSSSGGVTHARAAVAACCGDAAASAKQPAGCLVCGSRLQYFPEKHLVQCAYCQTFYTSFSLCVNEHYVCDACHTHNAVSFLKKTCPASREKDMIALMKTFRSHPSFPMHGPEYHALVPAVILTAYRNAGGPVPDDMLMAGIDQGAQIPGGMCGTTGACGAALGVGTAFALALGASPLKGQERQQVQHIVATVLASIAANRAARCCLRECFIALRQAASLSCHYLGTELLAEAVLTCTQHQRNAECIREACPLRQSDMAREQ